MTTINNDQSLIEKVGGIEKARRIVKWQSESSWADYYCISANTIGSAGRKFSEELCLKNNDFVLIDDLRTAIAKHDSPEFKVGDLVCFIDSRIMFPDGETKTNELFRVIRSDGLEVDLTEIGKLKVYKTWVGDLRHVTPEEIKAGHRLDDTTDHVTDKVTEI